MKRLTAVTAFLLLGILLFPAGAMPFGKNKIVYDEFHWKVYHSTHFDVYFYEEERASLQKVVNMAESAYDDLSRKFNFQVSKKIPLIFYATHSAFEQTNVILTFIPEGVGAFAEPVRNRMVLPIDMPDEKLLQLVTHELTHIFEYEILFQGKLGKEITAAPPTWFMEGLASFMAQDEDTTDRMVLRDAVVNDMLPSVKSPFGGYFAYRFGHAVFHYIVEKYGWDGLRDFIYEYRNNLSNQIDKPLKRAFDIDIEEFDTRFRTWLRKQYLPALVSKGEPTEYGEPFRMQEGRGSQDLSGVPSPSGDLLVALTTYKEDVDLALMNVPKRKMIRNLSSGFPDEYEYVIAQYLTSAPVMGRDVAISPDGDHVAVFVKKERGRNLLLVNALSGEIERSIPMQGVEQQLNPAFSPDRRTIAFHAFSGNRADIFLYDLESNVLHNVTNDEYFDAAPVFSPDGKTIIYSSVVGGYAKLFRLNLDNPSERTQLTTGEWNDIDASFAPDGKRIFYSSDRQTGRNIAEAARLLEEEENIAKKEEETPPANLANFAAYNVYSMNLENGETIQYTDVVGGAFTPAAFVGAGGRERIVFSSYYKGRWQMYTATTDNPVRTVAEPAALPSGPILPRESFVPPVEVAIDEEKIESTGGFRLFVDDIDVTAGVSSDQTFLSRSTIYMSDLLGGRRFIASLDSVSSFSNFDFLYFDLQQRLNWGVRLFDDRTFFVGPNFQTGQFERIRRIYRQTGAIGLVSYPFDRYHRIDAGAGYMMRDIDYPIITESGIAFIEDSHDFPLVSATFTGDSAVFKSFGPVTGRRYELTGTYAADLDEGGTLSSDVVLDFRQYLQVSARTLLAARLFTGYSDGNRSNFYYFGGLNTLRGYDFRTLVGNRAFFANFEFRFPLIDLLATPVINFTQIRGVLFFDVGGAYFSGDQDFTFMDDGKLQDARGAVGYGLSMRLFGLELHWDFAKRTDLDTIEDETRTSFWIGQSF